MEMACWTSSCHMESPWLSHYLSSGEIRCAPISGPLAPSLVCSQWPMKAQEPGLASQHDGKWELESLGPEAHMFPAGSTTSKRIPCSALCLLPRELLDLKPCPTVIYLASSFLQPTFLFSFSPPPPPLLFLFPPTLLYANMTDAHHLPSPRASATTGYVWCPAPGLGPSPGVPRLYSTPRRVGRTYGSLMGAPVTCVRWSLWHILA